MSPLSHFSLFGKHKSEPAHHPSPAESPRHSLDAHAATAELGANLHKRGELIESVNNKAESLAERAKEYRDRAHKERLKIEERKKHSWF